MNKFFAELDFRANIPTFAGMGDQHLDRIWAGLLEAERLSRYYLAISIRAGRFGLWTKFTLIALSVVISGGLLTEWLSDRWVVAISTLLVIVTIWAAFNNYSKKEVDAAVVADGFRDAALEWRALWVNCEIMKTRSALKELERLEKEMVDLVSFKEVIYIGLNEKINQRCTEEAYSVVEQEFNPNYAT